MAVTGLIPTYAGNTPIRTYLLEWKRAHPHVCGEHYNDTVSERLERGSSPRMRGTPVELSTVQVVDGLIPTYAGNTRCPALSALRLGAHPHVCGEHVVLVSGTIARRGSSPRMRGTQAATKAGIALVGLIPTYAGNTRRVRLRRRCGRAHPHVCGEHVRVFMIDGDPWGSSPRMRGTPPIEGSRATVHGLIPTYAGNTRRMGR